MSAQEIIEQLPMLTPAELRQVRRKVVPLLLGSGLKIQEMACAAPERLRFLAHDEPLRVNLSGGWYHVTAQCNERRTVFYTRARLPLTTRFLNL
jgi:hypothetical protein